MAERDEREKQILDAATTVIVRLGYDKTAMGDIAAQAGVSRRTLYLYFKSKDAIFEALFYREWLHYTQIWLDAMEADPHGGTLGGFYRAVNQSINSRPLIAALMRRDRHVIGNFLRKTDSIAARMASSLSTTDFVVGLQRAGAIRQDVDAAVIAHILEILSYGQLTIGDFRPSADFPPSDTVINSLAEILDRALLPDGAQAGDAGKAFFQQMAAAARAQLQQIAQSQQEKRATNQGA